MVDAQKYPNQLQLRCCVLAQRNVHRRKVETLVLQQLDRLARQRGADPRKHVREAGPRVDHAARNLISHAAHFGENGSNDIREEALLERRDRAIVQHCAAVFEFIHVGGARDRYQ